MRVRLPSLLRRASPTPAITQPWNRVIFPWSVPNGQATAPLVWDAATARSLPSVARAVALYSGMISQVAMNDMRGETVLPRPSLLDQPDPNMARSLFVTVQIEDYLLNGNALCLITDRDATGWPSAVAWLPASWVSIGVTGLPYPDDVAYWAAGVPLNRRDIIHVRRGADRWCPHRGVGVVEGHLSTLDRVANEERYEADNMATGAVPSVAIITPNARLSTEEAGTAKTGWLEKFTRREPAILPSGTQVIPLAWSPADAELTAARTLSLLDIANIFNLDGYWVGAPAGSMTYRSPGQMYTALLRVSLEPVLAGFEDTWSAAWLPRGRRVRFDRLALVRDDIQTMVQTMSMAVSAGLMTIDEARIYMGLPALDSGPTEPAVPAPAASEDVPVVEGAAP